MIQAILLYSRWLKVVNRSLRNPDGNSRHADFLWWQSLHILIWRKLFGCTEVIKNTRPVLLNHVGNKSSSIFEIFELKKYFFGVYESFVCFFYEKREIAHIVEFSNISPIRLIIAPNRKPWNFRSSSYVLLYKRTKLGRRNRVTKLNFVSKKR